MQIGTAALLSSTLNRSMTDLRSAFDDLNRQLSTGKVSSTYAGLGTGRATSLAVHAQVSKLNGYNSTIDAVNLRVGVLSNSLTRLSKIASEQRSDIDPTDKTIVSNGQTRAQIDAGANLDEALSILSTDVSGSTIFGGRATDRVPVATSREILDGTGTQAGLKAVIAERRQADIGTVDTDLVGTDTVGRLSISAISGTSFTIGEDGVHPFGFKLAGGATTATGATISTPSGSPPSQTIDLPTQPSPGQTFRVSFTLPDGTTDDITLTAVAAGTPGRTSDQIEIGATAADTLTNLRTAIVTTLGTRSQTTLAAASSVVSAKDFFAAGANTPPQRVAFTPPATAATATALRNATPTDTVVWYRGDDDPALSARQTATATIDNGITVNYGVRANEEGIAKVVRSLALYAAEIYPANDPNQGGRASALADRVRDALQPDSSEGSVTAIATELAGVQRLNQAAESRNKSAIATANDLLAGVENADDQEVTTKLLAAQTRLQATYQTTSMLSKLSLVNYLG